MTTVPSNLIPTRITQLPEYAGSSTAGYLPYVIDGITYKVQFSNIAAVGAVPSSRTITGGSGLTGGGDLTTDRVISIAAGGVGFGQLADSGVVAGTYGDSANIPVLTVDQKGRVTVASTTAINLAGYVPTSRSILAGAGLSGGGTLAADRTISLTLSSATPQPGGVPSAGSGTVAAREDHVHPAVDLSDTTETSGVLPMSRGGTGGSLSPVAGALVYSDGSKFDLATLGSTGQALFGNGAGAPTWHTISTSLSGLTMGFVGANYTLSGTLGITSGGTGATTAAAALANLLPSYGGNAGKILAVNGSATGVEWALPLSAGTVTSVGVDGGATGLTTTGGPITTSGAITLGGTVNVASGGTGATTAAAARVNLLPGYTGNAGKVLAVDPGGTDTQWIAVGGTGTVTSIDISGGSTGLTATGGPVTSSGTITLAGTLGAANGGTGQTSYTDGQILIGKTDGSLAKATLTAGTGIGVSNGNGSITVTNSAPDQTVVLTGGTGISTGGTYPSFTITNSAPDQVVSLSAGTGISVSGSYPSFTVTNSAPDQIVSLTGAGTTSTSGTYPNFTITSNDQFVGTVTSVAASGGTTGLTFSGSPITTTGTLTLSGTLAVANGGTGATVAGTARSNLGAAASGANTDITSIGLTSGTISTTPTSGTDIVNKAYADSIASGINFHQSVRLATATALPANTYNNGTSGVGATLTGNANGALSVDGVAVVAGNRILVKNEAAGANNGVYTVTQVGDGSTPYILTRATDFDSAGTGVDQIDAGDFFLVTAGSTQSNTSWVQQTPLPITVGTTAITFTQFAAPVLYSAGTGLTLGGTVFSITNTGVSASTYGSASSVPVLAINAQGQVTSASNSSIAIAGSQVTSGSVAIAQGGTGATTAATARANLGSTTVGDALFVTASASAARATLGATTVGDNLFTVPNPSAITFPRFNADNTVSALDAATFRTAIGAGTGNGTVTSVGGTGTVNGLTLTGTVTSSGNLTLGGTLSGISLTTQVTDTLPVANGGTGATTLAANNVILGNGTSAVQTVAPGASGNVLTSNGTTWTSAAAGASLTGVTQSVTPFETALGFEAGLNTTGINNTFVGYQAGKANTSGADNTAVGYAALDVNTTGYRNVAFGTDALGANTTGYENTAVGRQALLANNVGYGNSAFGLHALIANTSGFRSSAFGFKTLEVQTTGSSNCAFGNQAGPGITTGSNNILIGDSAGGYSFSGGLTTGSNNIIIGYQSLPSSSTVSNETTIGNSSTTSARIFGDVKFIKSYTETVFAVTDGATVNLDPNNGSIQTWTLGASRTPGQVNWAAGQSITLMIFPLSASFTITWTTLGVMWETNGGSAPTLSTSSFTVIVLWKVGTTIYGARVGDA